MENLKEMKEQQWKTKRLQTCEVQYLIIYLDLLLKMGIHDHSSNFIGKLERNEGTAMFFIIEKFEETIFEFSQNAATVV